MRRVLAGLVAVGVSVALAGCGSGSGSESESATSAATTPAAPETSSAVRPNIAGSSKTINDYITENKIAEAPINPDEPGTPD